jgi:ATP-dependent helicase/DNAse subunit B
MDDRRDVTVNDLAAGAESLLENYGPTPQPSEEEDERTPDQTARNRLIERLRRIQDMEPRRAASAPQLAGRLKTWLGLAPFVQAQRPRPGRAHVVPLESAGYADRDRLYVVGLDAASTQSAVPDDPLLSDEEREALSDDARALPLRRSQADADAWRTRQALARHEGPLTLSASTYSLAENENLFESPLFLRLKETSQQARDIESDPADPQVEHFSLAPAADTLLSSLDQWTGRGEPPPAALDSALTAHPWIQAGLRADDARDADAYTPHDGLLDGSPHPDLDPFSGPRPVSAGRLETYAQAPYAYFLRYILGVEPLDEPALDDVAWLDARGRGAVLHDTFRRFMDGLGRQPTLDDAEALREVFQTVLDEQRDQNPPPSEVVYASTRRQLWNDARLFLRAEAARSDDHRPHDFEVGFGYPPHRQSSDDYDDAPTLTLGDLQFSLRGRIDRVDRLGDGTFGLWDYKTGSARSYDEEDLVAGDFHLQWALYAYAYESLTDATVDTAGYFFTSTDEMGKRISASPAAHRSTVARVLQHISEGIAAGAFPVTDADALRYSYDRLFHDYGERRKQLTAKDWDDARPAPPGLRSD